MGALDDHRDDIPLWLVLDPVNPVLPAGNHHGQPSTGTPGPLLSRPPIEGVLDCSSSWRTRV